MKTINLILAITIFLGSISAQKINPTKSPNLSIAKSSLNRLVYPTDLLNPDKAQSFLMALEQIGNASDATSMKTWISANFRRFGINPTQIKQIFIFASNQFSDCSNCKKNCKGLCAQDIGTECICITHLDPKAKIVPVDKPVSIIYFATTAMEEDAVMELVAKTIAPVKTPNPDK